MPSAVHSKTSATLQLTSTENQNQYIHTKYTSTLAKNVGNPLKVRVLNMSFDAKQYSASDLIDYINLSMEGKWQDGSAYTPSTTLFDMREPWCNIQFATALDNGFHTPMYLNDKTNPPDLRLVRQSENDDRHVKYDTKIVRFVPGIVQYRSEPLPEWLEILQSLNWGRFRFECYDSDKITKYSSSASVFYPTDFIDGILDSVCAANETHCILIRIDSDFNIDWYLVGSKTTF